ncbi:MAG: indolepyruvate oxidoreductase subunit beta [Euryarchaeota archaeon]|nr:indolepyruvate oxidoreductase subunit beta [Euryarchaeota archaeon]
MRTDILISGVGGQGILLTTHLIGTAAISMGLKVMGAETHGMAQRGGSVVSHVRIGDVHGPLIPKKGADFLIAFEPLEAARQAEFLKDGGRCIMNTEPVPPVGAKKDIGPYPNVEDMVMALMEFAEVYPIDASALARKAGSPLTLNVVLLGAASACEGFPVDMETLQETISSSVPPKTVDMNLKAFRLGREEIEEYFA